VTQSIESTAQDTFPKVTDQKNMRGHARFIAAGPREKSEPIIGDSPAMLAVLDLVGFASQSDIPVLLTGPTGSGKEVLAKALHRQSRRQGTSFFPINCAATPEALLESELFGHRRGAFTGADRDRKGLFEEAHGATLFLDEVTETTPAFQAKLLRVLQEGEVRAIGDARSRSVDVRIIAATNRNLINEVKEGRFREDLYYRLAVFLIEVPALAKRWEDVLPLAQHFLARYSRREGKPLLNFSSEAEDILQAYVWPGNVRQLENEIQRAVVLAQSGNSLGVEHFSSCIRGEFEGMQTSAGASETLREKSGRYEAWIIRKTRAAHGGSRTKTARVLGLPRVCLKKKIKRLKLS
jgi:transcriptional regulator with PAS, ATPase and Fis domain